MKRFGAVFFSLILSFALALPGVAHAKSGHQESVSSKYKLVAKAETDGKNITVTAQIDGADAAKKGHWLIKPLKTKGQLKVHNKHRSNETSYSYTYQDVQPGEYCFKVKYNGKLNNEKADTVLWTKTCVKVVPSQEPPKTGETGGDQPGDDNQQGGDNQQGDDQTQPDDKGQSGNNGQSGEIPNNKSGQGGGQLPKTATSHPQSMLIGLLLALVGAGILAYRRRFA